MHNLDEEDTEGFAGSPGGIYSLWDQGEAPSHTCFKPFCIPYPLLQVPAGKKPTIEYLYGNMPGIHENIWARKTSLVDWEVIQIILTSIKCIVASIVLNQCSGKEWILSEEIMDMIQIYTCLSGDDTHGDVSKILIQW